MAYTLGNECAKKCCKRTILVQLIVENVVTCFLRHSVAQRMKETERHAAHLDDDSTLDVQTTDLDCQ